MGTTLFGTDGPIRYLGHDQADFTPRLEEDLVVQPLSRSQWRVSDRRYPEHDASSLLGFIEEKHDTFELTQLEHGFQWFYFSSLADAVAHFTQPTPHDGHAEQELSWSSSNV